MADSYLCPLPWIHYATRNNGSLRVCCHANVSENQGSLKNASQNLTTTNSSIRVSRNSETLKSIRRQMLLGQCPKECSRCLKEENNHLISRRNMETEKWKDTFSENLAAQWTKEDGSIDVDQVPLVSFDLRFGNLCNLRCRMCGPTDSNAWYHDYIKVNNREFFDDTHGRVYIGDNKSNHTAYDWHQQKSFWLDLETQIDNIRHLYLVGGEPLLISHHIDFLDYCVKSNHAKHIELEYNTNLTVLPSNVLNLWQKFKAVRIGVSMDGLNTVNNYIRYPSDFNKILNNIAIIDTLTNANISLWISPTVQILNIFHLSEMVEWAYQQKFSFLHKKGKKRILAFHVLHNPAFYCIQSLPMELKLKAKDKIESFIHTKHKDYSHHLTWPGTVKNLESIIAFMLEKDNSKQFSLFLQETKVLDKIRKQNFLDIIPELNIESKLLGPTLVC